MVFTLINPGFPFTCQNLHKSPLITMIDKTSKTSIEVCINLSSYMITAGGGRCDHWHSPTLTVLPQPPRPDSALSHFIQSLLQIFYNKDSLVCDSYPKPSWTHKYFTFSFTENFLTVRSRNDSGHIDSQHLVCDLSRIMMRRGGLEYKL